MEEIIRDPWQWQISFILTFVSGKYGGGMAASPFHNQAEAAEFRDAFLGLFESRCKTLGIEIHYEINEISQIKGASECVNEDFNPALAASDYLAEVLASWIRIANTELCCEEPDEDGFVSKRI